MNFKHLLLTLFLVSPVLLSAQTVGTIVNEPTSWQGFTLMSPLNDTNTYLIDNCGQQIHEWESNYPPGNHAELNENGDLYRAGELDNTYFGAGGAGGIIEHYDWDGNLLWEYTINDSLERFHHDFEVMPNGNILAIVWERMDSLACIQEGRDPALLSQAWVWIDKIIELEPVGTNGANIVWEWNAWDHLVQDFDNSKNNFGDVANSPRKLNFNSGPNKGDWMHTNGIDYHPGKDIIAISVPEMNEVMFIDHSTSTAEAATSSGGNYGFGGDYIYRWGNPTIYDQGTAADIRLSYQHDVHWIPEGLPDAGKVLIFNNRLNDGTDDYSAVYMITPDTNATGDYNLTSGVFGPSLEEWSYTLPLDLETNILSGSQRMPNGNTLICSGRNGTYIEIDPSENIVWRYRLPISNSGFITQGNTIPSQFLFNAVRYSFDYPGFVGKDLTPGPKLEINPLNDCVVYANDVGLTSTDDFDIDYYPNPVGDWLRLEASAEIIEVQIMNLAGQVLFVQKGEFEQLILDVSEFQSGIYLLNVETKSGLRTVKIVKQ